MNPAVIAAIIGAVPAVIQTVQGAQQQQRGRKELDDLERPPYEIPAEVREMLQMARVQAADRYMPGEAEMRGRADIAAANQLAAAQQAGQASALAPVISAGQQKAQQDISVMAQQQQAQDIQRLTAALSQMAQYRDTEYQINKFSEFADRQARAMDLVGAGAKNIHGGISNIAALGSSLAMNAALGQSGTTTTGVDQNAIDAVNQGYTTATGGAPVTGTGSVSQQSANISMSSGVQSPATTPAASSLRSTAVGTGNLLTFGQSLPQTYTPSTPVQNPIVSQQGSDPPLVISGTPATPVAGVQMGAGQFGLSLAEQVFPFSQQYQQSQPYRPKLYQPKPFSPASPTSMSPEMFNLFNSYQQIFGR